MQGVVEVCDGVVCNRGVLVQGVVEVGETRYMSRIKILLDIWTAERFISNFL